MIVQEWSCEGMRDPQCCQRALNTQLAVSWQVEEGTLEARALNKNNGLGLPACGASP